MDCRLYLLFELSNVSSVKTVQKKANVEFSWRLKHKYHYWVK